MEPPTQQSIEELTGAALAELPALDGAESLEQWRIAWLGRRGRLTAVLRGLSGLEDLESRRRLGAAANRAKEALEQGLESRRREIADAALRRAAAEDRLDVTLPGRPPAQGRLHPGDPNRPRNLRRLYRNGLQHRRRPRSGMGLLQL